jgi:lysozyme family protein
MAEPQDPNLIDTRTPGEPAHAAPEEPVVVEPEPIPEPYNPEASPPVEDDPQPRPEPVLDAAKIGGLLAALVVAIAATVSLVLAGKWTDINALGTVLGALASAVLALTAYFAPVWQAHKARAKVTPLADPRDSSGRKLVARQ